MAPRKFRIPTDRKRIVCPLDSKHTCFEDQLSKHLKKCKKQQKDLPAYHQEGINSGECCEDIDNLPDKLSLSDICTHELEQIIDKVNKLYDENIKIPAEILTHSCLNEELTNTSYGIPAIRHRKQQASIIGHLQKMGLLKDDMTYVELGAGKGMLSHWIQKAGKEKKNCKYILVDRGTCRYKADNTHKWEENGPKFERIRMDIEHLNLGKVDTISASDNSVVAVGKHLCGSATDLAFRCVTQTLTKQNEEPDEKKLKSDGINSGKLGGLSIALCCHHRCLWKPYVGKNFFKRNGLSPRDFQILCKLSSWTAATWSGWKSVKEMNNSLGIFSTEVEHTNLQGNPGHDGNIVSSKENQPSQIKEQETQIDRSKDLMDSDTENYQEEKKEFNPAGRDDLKLSVKEREDIGRKSKRLIDFGRLEYLKEHQLDCDMKVYIEEQLTPENVSIFAKPSS